MMDLTTLARVREHQQRTDTTNTTQDDILESLITTASRMIENYTQREFITAGSTPSTRSFRYDGRGILNLAPYDARTVTSVTIDTDITDGETDLTSDEWRLWPIPAKDGVYSHLHIIGYGARGKADYPTWRKVDVTGTWGWASVPDVVERAAIMLTLELLSRTSSWHNDDGFSAPQGATAMPLHIRMMLAPYKRYSVGV